MESEFFFLDKGVLLLLDKFACWIELSEKKFEKYPIKASKNLNNIKTSYFRF